MGKLTKPDVLLRVAPCFYFQVDLHEEESWCRPQQTKTFATEMFLQGRLVPMVPPPLTRVAGRTNSWTSTKGAFFHPENAFVKLKQASFVCRYEFGGPWGVTAMMVGFPILMYYLWICLWFYDGRLVTPSSVDDIVPFLERMWVHVRDVRTILFLLS